MKKENTNYFKLILGQAEYCADAAQAFKDYTDNFNIHELRKQAEKMHEIEHQADIKKHEILEKLAREFIAPIDREDILALTQEIDNVVDAIEEVFTKFYVYNITELRSEVNEYGALFVEGTRKLCEICEEFENYKKTKTLNTLLIELNEIEERGDKVFFLGTRRLFTEGCAPESLIMWKNIIQGLDNCLDCCERASDAIERVILKNT
ncbi:MAG: DUF47 family protein [Eubacteriaceae bacterium]|nr:DUF47 family protein [Eubacteriaceae bacterium]